MVHVVVRGHESPSRVQAGTDLREEDTQVREVLKDPGTNDAIEGHLAEWQRVSGKVCLNHLSVGNSRHGGMGDVAPKVIHLRQPSEKFSPENPHPTTDLE